MPNLSCALLIAVIAAPVILAGWRIRVRYLRYCADEARILRRLLGNL